MGSNIFITPVEGTFDIASIRSYLDSQPDAFEAPTRVNTYLFVGRPSAVPVLLERCLDNPSELPYALLVSLGAEQIFFTQEIAGGGERGAGALRFLRWLDQREQFNTYSETYEDLTTQVRAAGVDSLYDEEVRSMTPPWTGELIQIGFFADFADSRGGVYGYRLKDCISESPQVDEDKLLSYLRSGHFYRAFGKPDEELYDVLDTHRDLSIEPALFTDGTYVWPSDLPYYVERYHAHLPRAFLHHARQNGWQVPASVDVSSLKMVDV